MSEATSIVLLGTGTPNAEPERSGPSVAVVAGGESFIVDAGPGVVRGARAAHDVGIDALAPERLVRVFLTHLHSDHTAGLPDLLLTPWVLGRREPLVVHGPRGTAGMVERVTSAYTADIEQRLGGPEPINETGWRADAREIEAGIVYRKGSLEIEAIPVRHGSWPAFGYVFRSPERTIVISGDTAPTETLTVAATDCDVLVHEVYSAERFRGLPEKWKRYHSRFHTSTRELATIAAAARPKLLVLYHQLTWGASAAELGRGIGGVYPGDVVSGEDLGMF